jgi:hypothetical protein
MKSYTAMISWFIYGQKRRVCTIKEKTIRNIMANTMSEAREIALSRVPAGHTPHLNCIWYN